MKKKTLIKKKSSLELDVGLSDGLALQRQQVPRLHRHDAHHAVAHLRALTRVRARGGAVEVLGAGIFYFDENKKNNFLF